MYSFRQIHVNTQVSTTHLLKRVRCTYILIGDYAKSPVRAILLHSPGRKPWVNCFYTFLSPVGAALPRRKTNARVIVPLLKELNPLLSVFTQGSISGFALISPWAMQEYRAYGTLLRLQPPSQTRDHCIIGQYQHNTPPPPPFQF